MLHEYNENLIILRLGKFLNEWAKINRSFKLTTIPIKRRKDRKWRERRGGRDGNGKGGGGEKKINSSLP